MKSHHWVHLLTAKEINFIAFLNYIFYFYLLNCKSHDISLYILNKNITVIILVRCRSAVVEVLKILSRIRCNDSIMDIAGKYHYEDVIYSYQLLNQEAS